MPDEPEADLLTKGQTLADRLKSESRKRVVVDAELRRIVDNPSNRGPALAVDDTQARSARRFAEDAAVVQQLLAAVNDNPQPTSPVVLRTPGRGPLFVGLIGAAIMLVAMVLVASSAVAFRLPALVTVPVILGGPLIGWALTSLGLRHRSARDG